MITCCQLLPVYHIINLLFVPHPVLSVLFVQYFYWINNLIDAWGKYHNLFQLQCLQLVQTAATQLVTGTWLGDQSFVVGGPRLWTTVYWPPCIVLTLKRVNLNALGTLVYNALTIKFTWLWIMDAVQTSYPQSWQVSSTLSPSYSQNQMAGQSSKHRSPSGLQYDRHRSNSHALSIALVRLPYTHARSQNSENCLLLRAINCWESTAASRSTWRATCCAGVMSYEDQRIAREMQRRQRRKDITSTSTAQSSQHVFTVCRRWCGAKIGLVSNMRTDQLTSSTDQRLICVSRLETPSYILITLLT